MTSYIGIDASLQSTGIAVLREGQPVRMLTIKTKAPTVSTILARQDRTARIVDQAHAFVLEYADDALRVAIEAPIFGAAKAGANGHTWDRAYLWWSLVDSFTAIGKVSEVNVRHVKQFGANDASADKGAMGYHLGREQVPLEGKVNDDANDAAWLALLAQAHYNPDAPVVPLHVYRKNVLKAVAW